MVESQQAMRTVIRNKPITRICVSAFKIVVESLLTLLVITEPIYLEFLEGLLVLIYRNKIFA